MTGKEFLQQALRIYRQMDCNLEQLQRLQELARKITPVLSGTPTVSTESYSRIETAVVEIQAQSDFLSRDIAGYLEARAQIASAIAKVPKENERLILEYRYLSFKSWRYIANAMNVTARRIYQLHEQALENFEKNFSVEDEFH